MISKTIGFRGLAYFQTHPYDEVNSLVKKKTLRFPSSGEDAFNQLTAMEGMLDLEAAPGFYKEVGPTYTKWSMVI